jgi:CubicO group peptidase (beta-lactamase class C family)
MSLSTRVAAVALAAFSAAAIAGCGPASQASPAATGPGGPSHPGVDAVFADLDRDGPGAAVGVLLGGEVVHRAGYGIAHLDYGVPITPETVFDIASISKQFGAMAALLLESDGRLDLDEDVRAYVPELPDFGVRITPRHLIHHTSGIRDWVHVMSLAGLERSDVISFDRILRMLFEQQAVNFDPGAEYAYSNTGYNLLARVIEAQSGMSFREFTRQRIFEPLGMSHTHFSDDHLEVVPGRAESYSPDEAAGFVRLPNQLTALASSSLNTTIDDFILWMRNYETGEVGGEEVVRTMVEQGVLTDGETLAYAHGLTVGEYRGLRNFGHGGSWAGYRTNFVRFPEQDLSIAVFCNVSDCDPAGRALRIAEVFAGELMGPAPAPVGSAEITDAPPAMPTEAQLREYAGRYRSPELDMTYEIAVEDGKLVARHWRTGPSALAPAGEDTFSGDPRRFPELRFRRDGSGRVVAFTVTGGRVRDLIFERVG